MTSYTVHPRSDLRSGFFWVALGALIVLSSWRMDRLENQGATLYSAPGLWPGIVGLILALMGGALVWRSRRRVRTSNAKAIVAADDGPQLVPRMHFWLAATMFFVYAVLLVGRGLPFWFGTWLFVTAYVWVFRRAQRAPDVVFPQWRDALFALTCAVATATVVPFVFERLFYVRLP